MSSQYLAISLLLVGISLFSFQTSAFSLNAVSRRQSVFINNWRSNTRLYEGEEATEEKEEAEDKKESEESEEKPTDILNSPAFLKRKLEVLTSDISKTEDEIAKIKVSIEEGKAEWGERLEQLDKENSNIQERLLKQSKGFDGKALIDVVRKLLGVLDNFDRAFTSVTSTTEEKKEIEA